MSYSLASYMAKTFCSTKFQFFSYFHYCASRGVLSFVSPGLFMVVLPVP